MTGRRVYTTVLFSDVSGSSELADRLDAEEYAQLLDQFRTSARAIIPRHGGAIARLQGDGVLALFGHLEPREDDGRRATEAALDLHAAVGQLRAGHGARAVALRMHSGVHGGLVLLLEGDIERGRYDVVGEVPNTAARLCSLAEAGEVAVSEESLGPRAADFVATRTGSLKVRGRADPLSVLRVTGRTTVPSRRIDAAMVRGSLPFVGRGETVQRLLAGVGQIVAGGLKTMVLMGEPGIGKTRTMAEFVARLADPGVTVLQGHCESYLAAEPMQPFLQCVRPLADAEPGQASGVSTQVRDALQRVRSDKATPADAAAARSAILHLLHAQAQQQALVLLLDDWQWADDASRALLQALCASSDRLLVVLAVRPMPLDDLAVPEAQVLRLQPLEAQESVQAIASWLPGADPLLIEQIAAQAGGTPLFIEELCHASTSGVEVGSGGSGRGMSWVNALIASRMTRLSAQEIDCLQVCAVVGTVVEYKLLEHLLDAATAPRLANALVSLDFLVPDGQVDAVRFRHGITRDAVYATVDLERRRMLHCQVAQALLDQAGPAGVLDAIEAIAYHFDAAGRHAEAAQHAEGAGNRALAAMALDRARAYYLMALRCLDSQPMLSDAVRLRWCEIAQKLGQTCVFDVLDVEELLELFRRAASLAAEAGDDNALARAEYWLGYVYYGKGQPRHAVRHSEAALRLAQATGDERLAAQVQATLGQSLASAGQYDRALPLLEQAVAAKRQHSRPGSGAAIGSAYTLARIGYTLGDQGRFGEAAESFEESLGLLGDPSHAVGASIHELRSAVHLWQGRWAEAAADGRAGAAIALRCRSRFNSAMGRALAACADWADRADADALQVLREATHWIAARGGAVSTSLNYGWLVEATLAQGLEAEGRQHMALLLLRARAQDRHGEAQGWRAIALTAARHGQHQRATYCLEAAARAADARCSARESAVNALWAAQVALLAGDRGQALRQADAAASAFDRMRMAWHLGLAQAVVQ